MEYKEKQKRPIPTAHKVCVIALCLQMLWGGVITLRLLHGWMYGVLAGLLLVLLFMWWIGRDTRGVRVTVRVVTGIAYAFAGVPLLQLILSAATHWSITPARCVLDVCSLGLPVLLWLSPVAGVAALRRGRYDRFVAGFTQVWLLATAVLAVAMPQVRDVFPWLWDNTGLAYLWIALILFATVTVFLCALRRPREEIAVEGTTLSLDE